MQGDCSGIRGWNYRNRCQAFCPPLVQCWLPRAIPARSLHGSSGAVKEVDLLFLLSKTGETRETCSLAKIVQPRGTPIISLTAAPGSTIARLSQVVIVVKTPSEVDPYNGLMGVGSSLAMESVCDALVFNVLETKGTPQERFISGHPGGIIDTLSRENSEKSSGKLAE